MKQIQTKNGVVLVNCANIATVSTLQGEKNKNWWIQITYVGQNKSNSVGPFETEQEMLTGLSIIAG